MPGVPPTTPNFAIPRYAQADPATFSSQVNGISDQVDSAVKAALDALVPSGSMIATARATAPAGWLICDGSAVSRVGANAALFAAIGTTYGIGDGGSTFNLPDLRGRVPVGVDGSAARLDALDALGNAGGAQKHTLIEAEMPSHLHQMSSRSWVDNALGGASGLEAFGGTGGSPTTEGTQSTGGGGAHNNMQPYQVVHWMVKL